MPRSYFDHNATTAVSDAVLEVYLPALRETYGNASSIHQTGQAARQLLERARQQVATLLHASPKEIVFTSGGTESNNLALFGVMRPGGGGHLVVSAIEHPAVLNPAEQLRAEGLGVTVVAPTRDGVIEAAAVAAALRSDTRLVSVMHANNEIGTIQPIQEIADVVHAHGALLHVDGVQAVGKIPVDVTALGADLYSLSAHKLNAPKGVGALYIRRGITLAPLQFGGRHESGRRAGTENVPGAVALGAACAQSRPQDSELRDHLEAEVLRTIPDTWINGASAARLPNTASIGLRHIEGEAVVIALDLRGFAISSGSACSSGAVEPSHVLLALGLSKQDARSCIRISLGPENTRAEVDALIQALQAVAQHLRRLSPQAGPVVPQYA